MSKTCCSKKGSKRNKINKQAQKKGFDPVLLGIGFFTLLLVGLAVLVGSKVGNAAVVEATEGVEIVVTEKKHDWGEIGINDGIVSKTFQIVNSGDSPLELANLKTSCMCTTAQIITTEGSSKKYGMHESSSSVFSVLPGDSADLVVEFDPAFHGPSGTGPISRTISMDTNDPDNSSIVFAVSAVVVK